LPFRKLTRGKKKEKPWKKYQKKKARLREELE
jgi:putative RNA 2'-phosphotransferase